MKQGVAILEITGLGPALVTLDTIEKTAPIEILQCELNDFYGICADWPAHRRPLKPPSKRLGDSLKARAAPV